MPDNVASSPAGRSLPSINAPSIAARAGSPISAPTCAILGSEFMAALSAAGQCDATRFRETLNAVRLAKPVRTHDLPRNAQVQPAQFFREPRHGHTGADQYRQDSFRHRT